MLPPLVLASSSRYRAQMLVAEGLSATVDPPDVDERLLDDSLPAMGADGVALELARRKADSVRRRHPASIVIAGDQVGIVDTDRGPFMLTKQGTVDAAVDQLMVMSGTAHQLVNGLVLLDTRTGGSVEGVDRQVVAMRRFTPAEAREYVVRFEPFDSSGSYRLEDQDVMAPLEPFVIGVEGEHDSGVRGLPLPLLRRLLAQLVRDAQ